MRVFKTSNAIRKSVNIFNDKLLSIFRYSDAYWNPKQKKMVYEVPFNMKVTIPGIHIISQGGNTVAVGDTYAQKAYLETKGFRFFGQLFGDGSVFGQPGKIVEFGMMRASPLTPVEVQEFSSKGFDMSKAGQELPRISREEAEMKARGSQPEQTAQSPSEVTSQENVQPPSPPNPMDANVLEQFRNVKSKADVTKATTGFIADLVNMLNDPVRTEEAKKRIMEFRDFMSNQWKYSPSNLALIMIQSYLRKKPATMVGGEKNLWNRVGRQLKPDAQPMWILAPEMRKKNMGRKPSPQEIERKRIELQDKGMTPEQIETELSRFWATSSISYAAGFKGVNVYDISDTAPIPGWKDPKTGKDAYDPSTFREWSLPSNKPDAYVDGLAEAAYRAMRSRTVIGPNGEQISKPINVSEESIPENVGGYSAGGKVVINKASAGARRFLAAVHEYAHEILLTPEERVHKTRESIQLGELDAESTAYIVSRFFELDKLFPQELITESNARYLISWKATPERIYQRQQNIQKAVKEIVESIQKNLPVDFKEQTQDNQTQTDQSPPSTIANIRIFSLLKTA